MTSYTANALKARDFVLVLVEEHFVETDELRGYSYVFWEKIRSASFV